MTRYYRTSYNAVFVFSGGSEISFNCAARENMHRHYCLEQFYFFRCMVYNSINQVIMVDGEEMFRLGPESTREEFFPQQPFYFVPFSIVPSTSPLQTTYISFMWYEGGDINASTVTCEGGDSSLAETVNFNTSSKCIVLLM